MKQIITTYKGTTYERERNVNSYYTHLHIRIDEDTINKIRCVADEKGVKYSDIVRNLIKDYLDKEDKEKGNNYGIMD